MLGLFVFAGGLAAQQPSDLELVSKKVAGLKFHPIEYHHPTLKFTFNPLKLALRTAMYIYQKEITYLTFSSCMYHPSCSEFSRQCIEKYGIIKGGLLTLDRLTRCNSTEARTARMEKAPDGRFIDLPEYYARKK